MRLLLAGEVDCVYDYKPTEGDPLSHYLELKTSRVISDDKQAFRFEQKLLKTWAQSFLLGVQRIVYGFRDDNGILRAVEEYTTDKLPIVVKNSTVTSPQKKWNGVDAVAFFGAILEWIRKTVKSEGTVWRLQYHAGSAHVDLFPLKEPESKGKFFLLKEFVDWRNELKQQEGV